MASNLKSASANQARKRHGVAVRTVTVARPQTKSAGTEFRTPSGPNLVAEAAPTSVANAARGEKAQKKLNARANIMLDTLLSVQGDDHDAKQRPRWFKIATWALVLTPALSILIYFVGFIYLWPAYAHNVGLNTSLAATPTTISNGFAVPDQDGVFIQRTVNGHNYLDQILQFTSRTLQPPISAQYAIPAADLHALMIRQAQLDTPDRYMVYKISDGHQDVPVSVAGQRLHLPQLAVIALTMGAGKSWAPGDYMVVVPDLDSSDYWAFFSVS